MSYVEIKEADGSLTPLNIETLDQLPKEKWNEMKGRLVRARQHIIYDKIMFVGDQPFPQGAIGSLFQRGIQDDGQLANVTGTGGTYRKTRFHTNMEKGGMLPKGTHFVAESIQFYCDATTREFIQLVAGEAVDANIAAADSTMAASNQVRALGWGVGFNYKSKGTDQENGPIVLWPGDSGFSGWSGGSTAEGLAQIGMGHARMLNQVKRIPDLSNFQIDLESYLALTPAQAGFITGALVGVLLEPIG